MEASWTSKERRLGPSVCRLLTEKSYEKRKQGAIQVETVTRELLLKGPLNHEIEDLIQFLTKEFISSIVPNTRNGGLISLAAIAIALGQNHLGNYQSHSQNGHGQNGQDGHPNNYLYLSILIPPILACFSDHDGRVRYYACESMYNVAKVARSAILPWFNEIFDALTRLSVDVEQSVKNGAELLDRLIKDIVCEKSTYYHALPITSSSDVPDGSMALQDQQMSRPGTVPGSVPVPGGPTLFNLPRFIPLLIERIQVISAPSRLFLIQWIFVLSTVPDLELVGHLSSFLPGLLNYLSDSNVDVRTATLAVLADFLKEISTIVAVQRDKGGVLDLHLDASSSTKEGHSAAYTQGHATVLEFGKMTETLARFITSTDQETQATSLRWISSFLGLAGAAIMVPYTPLLLRSVLPTLSHPVPAIKTLSIDANSALFSLVVEGDGGVVDVGACVQTLMEGCGHSSEESRIGALEWLVMLHKKYPVQVMSADHSLFQACLATLTDISEEVVRRDLQLLAQISHSSDDAYFNKFMINLISLFTSDRRLLETRGGMIIRQLCLHLNPERMYRSFSEILEQESDLEFATTMVQTLNLIMITAPEMGEMRRRLKSFESRDGISLFLSLHKSWSHNPISCFTLCLLCQAYEHASYLIGMFGDLEITVPFLIQTDKLVQLIESPVFTFLRLHLLEPERYPHLYKCMYGLLMLLPQSSAFATLRNRLNSLGSLATLSPLISQSVVAAAGPGAPKKKGEKGGEVGISYVKWSEMMAHFRTVQNRHQRARRISMVLVD